MENLELRDFIYKNLKGSKAKFYYRDKYRTWKWNFGQVLENGLKFASLLEELGITKGEKVVIKAPNNPQWLIVFLGCILAGRPVVPLDLQSSQDFTRKVIGDVEPGLLITGRDLEEEASNLDTNHIFLEDVEDKISGQEVFDFRKVDLAEDDMLEIIYTSGTTSVPKGVVLTYKNIESNLKMALPLIKKWKKFFKYIPGTKLLTVVPLSHMYGQVVGLFIPVSIQLPVLFSFSMLPKDILEIIKKEKVIALGALPHQLKTLKHYIIQAYRLDSPRFKAIFEKYKKKKWWIRYLRFIPVHAKIGLSLLGIISGGAEISREVDEFYRTIAFGFFQGYGLTETAPLIALYDPTKNKAGSVGSFLDQENIKVEDGELYIKGESVTPGYYKNKEKTSKSFKDGWFKTGDLVEVDESGNVYVKGRKDEVIVKESGINVYPSDVEEKFKEKKEIEDCVVFGLGQNGRKEIIAVLLPKERKMEEGKIDAVVEQVNSELNVHQRVDNYFIWRGEDFPRTSTMNVKKRELLEKIQKTQKGDREKLATDLAEEYKEKEKDLYSLIEKIKKTKKGKNKEASLEKDLGMDSMDIINFSTEIEKNYGIDSSQLDLTGDTKVKDIEEKIKNPPKESERLPFFSFPYNKFFIVVRTIFQFLIFPFARMLYRSKVTGKQNLKDIDTPSAFISNHVSVMDSLVILYSLPLRIRVKLSVVMSIGHHFSNFFGKKGNILRRFIEGIGFYLFVSLFLNVIPLSREYGFQQVFRNIGMAIDRGWHVLIFPEGGVTEDGKMQDFEPGIGVICKDMKIPVVPMKIDGLWNILRNGLLPYGHLPKLPMVKVKIGKQNYFKEGSYQEIAENLHHIVKDKL